MRAVAIPTADPQLEPRWVPDPGFLIQGFLIQGLRRIDLTVFPRTRGASTSPRAAAVPPAGAEAERRRPPKGRPKPEVGVS